MVHILPVRSFTISFGDAWNEPGSRITTSSKEVAWSCVLIGYFHRHIHKECPPWQLHIPFPAASYLHCCGLAQGSSMPAHWGTSQETSQLCVGGYRDSTAMGFPFPDALQRRILLWQWKSQQLLECDPSRGEDKLTGRQSSPQADLKIPRRVYKLKFCSPSLQDHSLHVRLKKQNRIDTHCRWQGNKFSSSICGCSSKHMEVYFTSWSPGDLMLWHDTQSGRSFVLSFEKEEKVEVNNSRSYKTFIQGVICTGMEHQEKAWIISLSVPFYGWPWKCLKKAREKSNYIFEITHHSSHSSW